MLLRKITKYVTEKNVLNETTSFRGAQRRGAKRQDSCFATRSDPKGEWQEPLNNLMKLPLYQTDCRSRSSFAMTDFY